MIAQGTNGVSHGCLSQGEMMPFYWIQWDGLSQGMTLMDQCVNEQLLMPICRFMSPDALQRYDASFSH